MTFELTDDEHTFLTAAVDCFIPADNLTPSGSDCGVVDFIATQLASEWGAGARLYRDGPIQKGKPEHGYQLGLTPRELFRVGIAGANAYCRRAHGKDFAAMDDAGRTAALTAMESGSAASDDFPAKEFFEALLGAAMEGFFADPIYGGNRDLAAWKMIGYPGLPASYRDAVTTSFGKRYDHPPHSLGEPQ
jgi:gluconate 2-dehydrogenase gamma chain